MSKYYVYKMTADNGGAPCVVDDRLLTLAICKPQIRKTAVADDIIFGFGAKAYGEKLIYIAWVTEKMKTGAYYQHPEHQSRPDCIYRWQDGKAQWVGKYHSPQHLLKDVGEHFERGDVLLSRNFRYFGRKALDIKDYPKLQAFIARSGRGHRVNLPQEVRQELDQLKNEAWMRWEKQRIGNPNDGDCSKACND